MNIYIPEFLITAEIYIVLAAIGAIALYILVEGAQTIYKSVIQAKNIPWMLWCAWRIKMRHGSVREWTTKEIQTLLRNHLRDDPAYAYWFTTIIDEAEKRATTGGDE